MSQCPTMETSVRYHAHNETKHTIICVIIEAGPFRMSLRLICSRHAFLFGKILESKAGSLDRPTTVSCASTANG